MTKRKWYSILTLIFLLALVLPASAAPTANLLTNGDFEAGDLSGWTSFGNAFWSDETGGNTGKLFGNFSGNFEVTGIFQEFAAAEGDVFRMDADSMHFGSDPMIGAGADMSNWVVMKMAFFDANGEIGAAESTILDGTFATDTWHDNDPVEGTAPAGTIKVQAFILYLQPAMDGGAAFVDNIVFEPVVAEDMCVTEDNLLANCDFEAEDLSSWTSFGNAFYSPNTEDDGQNSAKLFGNFTGGFDVTGIFQEFSANPGDTFTIDADSFHSSNDPMVGGGAPDDNWVVMKMAFFDTNNTEIGAAEGTILDASFATDTWHDNTAVMGTAPAGTVKVQAFILYLQPPGTVPTNALAQAGGQDGGAAYVDNIVFEQTGTLAVDFSNIGTSSDSSLIVTVIMLSALSLVAVSWRMVMPNND